jgi:hypothetical protein
MRRGGDWLLLNLASCSSHPNSHPIRAVTVVVVYFVRTITGNQGNPPEFGTIQKEDSLSH